MSDSFSAQLREATMSSHRDAAGGSFLRDLTVGRRGRDDYTRMLGQLWFVYGELEAAADQVTDARVATFVDEALRRAPSIVDDLVFLAGEGWKGGLSALPATEAYCAQMRERAADPLRFLAHHYTRYLGDLSGGQMIGRAIQGALEFGDDGVRFFRFADIDDVDAYKDRYRGRLDALDLTDAERATVIAEVHAAYAANAGLLSQLGEIGEPASTSAV